jgi:hypothetical protein
MNPAVGSSLEDERLRTFAAEPVVLEAARAGTVTAQGGAGVRNIEDEDTTLAEIM